jgi:putative endonuclease
MSELLNSNQTGDESKKPNRQDIGDKWENLGFLKGLKGHVKENIAKQLESDSIQFMPEYEDVDRWCVYILECIDGTLYTGISNNIVKRLRAHRNGTGAKYTRGRTPLTLEAMKVVKNKSEALKLEYKVKKQRKDKKIDFLRSYNKD